MLIRLTGQLFRPLIRANWIHYFRIRYFRNLVGSSYCLVDCTEVFGSTGSVGTGHFVRYSRKSVTLDIFNVKFQFGHCQNHSYFRKPLY